MDPETKKIIQESFKKLPARLREAILAAELPEKFRNIMTKHKLQLDQAADVENETMLVMLGLEHPDDYTENIAREAGFDETKAREIAEDVNRVIFLPIRSTLREFYEKSVYGEAAESPKSDFSTLANTDSSKSDFSDSGTRNVSEPQTDIFKEKMGGMMRMQKEETVLRLTKSRTPQLPQKTLTGKDPYREPVDEFALAEFKKESVTKETPEIGPDIPKTGPYAVAEAGAPPANLPTGGEPSEKLAIEKKEERLKNEPPPIIIGHLPDK